jgi:hypothetical protein
MSLRIVARQLMADLLTAPQVVTQQLMQANLLMTPQAVA